MPKYRGRKFKAGGRTYRLYAKSPPLKVEGRNVYGFVDYDTQEIHVEDTLKGKKLVEIILHEMDHAQYPEATEATVRQAAREKAELLHKLGLLKLS